MISTLEETIFTNQQGYFTATLRTIIFFILSTSLLFIYGFQKQNFDTQIIIWIIFTLLFSGISYLGPQRGALNTILLVLISISGGMVLANASITVKV